MLYLKWYLKFGTKLIKLDKVFYKIEILCETR